MSNKYACILGIIFLFTSCYMERGNRDNRNTTQSTYHLNQKMNNYSTPDSTPACVRSEGGYETDQYCILIINKLMPLTYDDSPQRVTMFIKDKKTASTQSVNGEEWINDDYNMYGFKARSKDKIYEIDWREEKTHFRIWDASHKKLLEDELVVVGPEDILKDKSANP